jgi:hypothetical protein
MRSTLSVPRLRAAFDGRVIAPRTPATTRSAAGSTGHMTAARR